ncbi:MAG: hypothetical protein AAFQ64_18820 [Pseudomonadota bacterium]
MSRIDPIGPGGVPEQITRVTNLPADIEPVAVRSPIAAPSIASRTAQAAVSLVAEPDPNGAEQPLFGSMSEGEIALAAALVVVQFEEAVIDAPPDVQRGHAALAELARMFEHLNALRTSPSRPVLNE